MEGFRPSGTAKTVLVQLTQDRTTLPLDDGGLRARYVYLSTTNADTACPCFRVGGSTVTAVATDTLIPVRGGIVVHVANASHLSAIRGPGSTSDKLAMILPVEPIR